MAAVGLYLTKTETSQRPPSESGVRTLHVAGKSGSQKLWGPITNEETEAQMKSSH